MSTTSKPLPRGNVLARALQALELARIRRKREASMSYSSPNIRTMQIGRVNTTIERIQKGR